MGSKCGAEAHDSEEGAFRNFVTTRPAGVTLLIDTYDTERAAHRVVALVRELKEQGSVKGIEAMRIDSGDLAAQARIARGVLDSSGCQNIRIVLSGGLDEHIIENYVRTGVAVDAFGVGTSLDVSSDAPALDIAYKLQEYAGKPRRKRSSGKATWPGAKQVLRVRDTRSGNLSDRIALVGEQFPGLPLLKKVMAKGHRACELPELIHIRDYTTRELQSLPPALRKLGDDESIPVLKPPRLRQELTVLADNCVSIPREIRSRLSVSG